MAEADESDGAFLVYRPYAAIVTNVEADHLDHWGTEEAYAAAFDEFADDRRPGRASWSAASTTRARPRWPSGSGRPAAGWSPCRPGRASATSGPRRWPACRCGRPATTTSPTRWPRWPPARTLGFADDDLVARASRPSPAPGAGWSPRARPGGVRVYDSYAHHPTEIAGDLAAARALAGEGRLVVAFQPHLVSRTRAFGAAMGEALGAADEVVVCDVYLAREDRRPRR